MVCPFCLHKKTSVYNSRRNTKLNVMWRRRRCEACGRQFTTYEGADPSSILKIREGKQNTSYSPTKLLVSVLQACSHRDDQDKTAPYLCGTIEQRLYKISAKQPDAGITKMDIMTVTSETLRNFDPAAYVAYIARHQKHLDAPTLRRALSRKK